MKDNRKTSRVKKVVLPKTYRRAMLFVLLVSWTTFKFTKSKNGFKMHAAILATTLSKTTPFWLK